MRARVLGHRQAHPECPDVLDRFLIAPPVDVNIAPVQLAVDHAVPRPHHRVLVHSLTAEFRGENLRSG